MAEKITTKELCDLFGGWVPTEVIDYIWTCPPDTEMVEVRMRIHSMGKEAKAKREKDSSSVG